MRPLIALTASAVVLAGCTQAAPEVTAADCGRLATAFASAEAVQPADRLEALRALDAAFPDQPLGQHLAAAAAAEEGFAGADSDDAAFLVALDLAVAMHGLADTPPVEGELADAVTGTCDEAVAAIARDGPDVLVAEPDATVGLAAGGIVDRFVGTLAAAHRRTDGEGCDVLREGLDIDPDVSTAPHLAADARSGELGCVIVDDSGPVLLVVLAVDGAVTERLTRLVTSPGRVVSVADVFGMAEARGLAAYDATSDGWLIVLTPGSPDPREAIARLESSLE